MKIKIKKKEMNHKLCINTEKWDLNNICRSFNNLNDYIVLWALSDKKFKF